MTFDFTREMGEVSWTHKANDLYVVTGVTTDGKRFAGTYSSWAHASGINLYRGSKWLLRDGKRKLITRTFN